MIFQIVAIIIYHIVVCQHLSLRNLKLPIGKVLQKIYKREKRILMMMNAKNLVEFYKTILKNIKLIEDLFVRNWSLKKKKLLLTRLNKKEKSTIPMNTPEGEKEKYKNHFLLTIFHV